MGDNKEYICLQVEDEVVKLSQVELRKLREVESSGYKRKERLWRKVYISSHSILL